MSHSETDGLADLARWRTFLAVYRTGSLTAAARTLGLAQPSVSAQLQALERALGAQLFERHARGVVPTPRADTIATRLAAPYDALTDAVAGVAGAAGAVDAKPVQLAGPAEFVAEIALPALAPIIRSGIRVRVTTGLAADLLTGLRGGQFDLVVAAERPRGRPLPFEPLGDEEFVLVGAPSSLGTPLGDLPVLSYAHDLPILRRYWRHVLGTRIDVEPALTFPDLRALRQAAALGLGITVLPRYLCQEAIDTGVLIALDEPEDPPINTLYLARRPGLPEHGSAERVRRALLDATAPWR
ncbi:LysR family transcriptional regulator [Nocardioides sp. GY 10113]|uniref:LysR family transcriptional regulator n=1 Tax=Nocardioides sp. GY 10113 TaxID=2569761 RepID=UPI0010A94C02|nr:LysR family transcriptional regulator [Nocardioides sp. GY 10113]TIC87865.1 LysR family transcriptional regulator [Nocardioides sp. GY 10113]